MRIVSLVPHATELLFALGLGDQVVAVTHECDFPPAARELPHVTKDRLPRGLDPAEIDAAVKEATQGGQAIYELDEELLHELQPDLIVTQELCPVCAVSYDDVVGVAERVESCPKVIALDPRTLGETMGDIRTVAQATRCRDAALDLVARQRARIDRVKVAVKDAERPTVAVVEWFDPVYVAGHWTPQIVELAGGVDVLGFAGEHSEQTTWEAVAAARPDVVLCVPCGFDGPESARQAEAFLDHIAATGCKRAIALDASAYFSRPGPRLVDGLETLAHALHPDLVPEAPGQVFELALPVRNPR